MNDECEAEADEFAAWCRKMYLASQGTIICIAGVDHEGLPSTVDILAPRMDMPQIIEFLRIVGNPETKYEPVRKSGETLQ